MRTPWVGLVLALLPCPSVAAPFDLQEIAPGVFAALAPPGHLAAANAGFVLLGGTVLVVDTHMVPSAARELIEVIRSRTTFPVRYVVNTHWHPDHTQGNDTYRAAFGEGTIFISHHLTRQDVAVHGEARLRRDRTRLDAGLLRNELAELELVLPNLTFSERLQLNDAARATHLLYFGRGHTRGDVVVYLPREKIAFVGDLITGGPPFARDGYPFAWVETLTALRELDIERIVAGHGRVVEGKRVLSDRLRFLEHATAIVREGKSRRWSVEKIAETIDLDAFRDTFEPEPAHSPWRDWMTMIAERGLAELGSAP